MKKIGFIFAAAGLIFLGAGCVSSGRDILLAQKDPIALVSVVSNWDINWKGEESIETDVTGPVTRRVLRRNPGAAYISNAEGLINIAEGLVWDTLAESEVIHMAEKDAVLNSRAYAEAGINRHQVNWELLKPDNYRFVDYRDKNFPSALLAETGIQRSMFVEFVFTKAMVKGIGKNGTCRAEVEMSVLIQDARGETLYKKKFDLGSNDSIEVLSGVYTHPDLMNLFQSAIADVCYEFLDDLQYN